MPTNVDVIIEGMIALFFEKKGNKIVACEAGVLMDAPGHDFELRIKMKGSHPTILPTGPIDPHLELRVSPNPLITFAEGKINRDTGDGDRHSFDWVVDFEGREVYDRPIGSRKGGFRSILHINDGRFFTRERSLNKLFLFDTKKGSCQMIGIVATQIGLQIDLTGGRTAQFFNGTKELFKATEKDQFEIQLLRVRQHIHREHTTQHHGDANYFYSAVGGEIPNTEKKVFSSTPFPPSAAVPPATPEAACVVPTGGRGPIGQP